MCRPDSQARLGCAERGREELVRRYLDGRVRTEAFWRVALDTTLAEGRWLGACILLLYPWM
jgi:hypothetical protein